MKKYKTSARSSPSLATTNGRMDYKSKAISARCLGLENYLLPIPSRPIWLHMTQIYEPHPTLRTRFTGKPKATGLSGNLLFTYLAFIIFFSCTEKEKKQGGCNRVSGHTVWVCKSEHVCTGPASSPQPSTSLPELLWQLWVQSIDSLYLPSGGYEPATLVGAFRGFSPSSQQLYEIGTRRTQRDYGFSSRTLQKSEYQNKPSHRKFLVFQCIWKFCLHYTVVY